MNDDLRPSISSGKGSSQRIQQGMAEAHDPSNANVANSPERQFDLALDIPVLQILDGSGDCIKVLDLNGHILFMNRGGQVLLDIGDIMPFLNTSWIEFWQESEKQAFSDAIARAAAGDVCSLEGYCPTLNGEPKWWDNKISPIRGTDGTVERLLCISRDITDRKRTEAEHQQTAVALRASETQFRLFTTASSNTVYKMSADWQEMQLLEGKDFLASPSYPNQTWLEQYIPVPEQSRVMAAIAEAIRTKSTFELEHRVIQQDGAIGWAFSRAIPLLDPQGEIIEWFGTASDVTVRRQTELNAECLALITQNLTEATCVEDIIQTVGEQLNHYFQVSICAFVEIDESAGLATIDQSWHQANEPSLVGVYRLSEFVTSEFFQAAKLGQAIIVRDVNADPNIVDPERFVPLKIGSFINIPLIRNGDWKFILGIYHQTPYNWRSDEIELMRELANRIWTKLERTRIEIALRQNQEIFSALVGDAPFGVCMIDSDFRFRQANQTAIAAFNVGPLIGRSLAEVLQIIWHEPFATNAIHYLRHTLVTGEPYYSPLMTEPNADTVELQSYDWQIHRITLPDGGYGVVCYFYDLSEIKRAQEVMRRNGDRDAFLVTLNDALRPLNNPIEILATANRVLGEQLGANRVTYFEVRGNDYFLEQDYVNGVESLRGGYPIESFGAELLATYRRGHTAAATDVMTDPNLSAAQQATYADAQIAAYIGVPLVKRGDFVAGLAVHSARPRNWTPEEIALTEEVAERTWATVERARAEAALRASEAKYRGLFESLDEGYFLADVIFDENNQPIDIFYLEANPAATRMVGQDFTGRRLREIDPDYEAYWYDIFGRVAQTGLGERLEQYAQPDRKWYDFYVFKVGDESSRRVSVVFKDITNRKRREANLALLAEITEAFSQLTTAEDIIQTVGAKLGAYLNLATCHLVEIDEAADQSRIFESWRVPEAPEVSGTYRISEFCTPAIHRALRAGETVAISDTQNSSWVKAEAYVQIGIRGFVTAPFHRFGEWKYLLSVTTLDVRNWQDDEVELIQELANRLVPRLERARAEALLQASHDTFRHLVNYSPFGIYTVDADFRIAQMSVVAQKAFANVHPLIGRDLGEALHILWSDPFASEAIAHFRHTLETGEPYHAPSTVERRLDLDEVKSYDWKLERITLPDGRFGVVCHFYDLSERQQFEAALRESEERFRNMADNAPVMIWVTDATGYCTYLSQSWYEFTGQTEETGLGSGWLDRTHPEDRAEAERIFLAANECQEAFRLEYRLQRRDGEYLWVIEAASPWFGVDGQFKGYIGSVLDISDRKRIEAQLRESEKFLQAINETAPNLLYIFDLNERRNVYVSPQIFPMLGLSSADVQAFDAQILVELFHPDDLEQIEQHHDRMRAAQEDDVFTIEYRMKHASGKWLWLSSRDKVFVRDEQGKSMQILGSAIDITDRKQVELALRESEALARTRAEELETLMEVVPVGIWLAHDPNCYQVTVNRAAYNLMRADPTEPTTATPASGIYPFKFKVQHNGQDIPVEELSLQKAGRTGQEVVEEAELVFEDGIVHYIYGRAVPLRNEAGEVRGVIGAYVDISAHKQAEAEREQLLAQEQAAREEAERANRIKDEFLAVLSHELRSPLNPIVGWAKLLQSGKLDKSKTAQALATIERNAKLQSELIEDLLDVSRILRGKLSLNVAPVNLAVLIREAMETIRLAAEAKSIQIAVNLAPDVGLVLGDSTRLQQVVWNLLSNAVKFTPPGGQVNIRLESSNASAQITVSDTGQGIAADFLPYVFDYFRQADAATTRKFGGLGLGLAIVRHLVEMHGGTVSVASPGEGQGATFTLRIPLASTSSVDNQDDRVPQQSLDLSGIKILVVDDEPDTRELVAFVLEQQGAQVTTATSAYEALIVLPQTKPDVLVSDIGIPEMDGYTLIQQVRALTPEQGGQTPAIALTAYAGDINQRKVLAAGFQKHISKPIEPEALVQVIVHLISEYKIFGL